MDTIASMHMLSVVDRYLASPCHIVRYSTGGVRVQVESDFSSMVFIKVIGIGHFRLANAIDVGETCLDNAHPPCVRACDVYSWLSVSGSGS